MHRTECRFAEVVVTTFSRALALVAVAASCSVSSSAIRPAHAGFAKAKNIAALERQTAQLQSVSGRITAIAGNTFTIQTPRNSAASGPKVITFTIDQDTVVEGRIEVGSKADVTFRQQDGNNIAVSVRVSAA